MATSVGTAASQGIESGFGLGMRLLDQQERQQQRGLLEQQRAEDRTYQLEDRAFQRDRQVKADQRTEQADQRQARLDARQSSLDEMKLLDSELSELTNEGGALFTQYGGFDKVPEDVRGQFVERVRTKREQRAAARKRFYEPDVVERKRDAAEKWSRIQAGQMSIDDLSDDDLYKSLTVMSRRDLTDFLAPEGGGPSKVQQAALDLEAGIKTRNMDLTLKGANVLLAPELRTGIGSPGRDGNEIIRKELHQLVPAPDDPQRIVPIVKVTVRRDDGATGSYFAPITEGRSSDPGDNVRTISMQEAFDRVGQLTTLGEALNAPEVRKRIEKGRQVAAKEGDEFLQSLGYLGVKAPVKKVTRDKLELGDRVIERELDDTGKVVGEQTYRKGAAPRAIGAGGGRSKPTGLALTLQTIDDQVDDGLLDAAEADELKRDAVRKAARGGKAGGASGEAKASEKVAEATDALALIDDARSVLRQGATGSYAGRAWDELGRTFGISTKGAGLAGKLKALEGALVAKMPKMSGPQSDKDVQLYRQQAALIGDDTVPVETRLAALDAVEEIQRRYAGQAGGASGSWGGDRAGGAPKPVQLSSDPKAAEAEFARLPSGATFIDPTGKSRRKP